MNNLHFDDDRNLICKCYEIDVGEPGAYDDFKVMIDDKATITIMCPECSAKLILKGAYIDKQTLNEKDQGGFQKASEIEKPEMTITQDQADYWMKVAKKDVSEGNPECAWNIQKWFIENNAMEHAQKLLAHIVDNETAESGSAACIKGDDDDGY